MVSIYSQALSSIGTDLHHLIGLLLAKSFLRKRSAVHLGAAGRFIRLWCYLKTVRLTSWLGSLVATQAYYIILIDSWTRSVLIHHIC